MGWDILRPLHRLIQANIPFYPPYFTSPDMSRHGYSTCAQILERFLSKQSKGRNAH